MTITTRARALPVRQFFVSVGLFLGVSVGKASETRQVASLLRRLRPVRTQYPLVRLGSDGDGGYLVPDDLEDLEACFSPGVDNRASFERDLIDRGIRCFLADASVNAAPYEHELIEFERKFLDVHSSTKTMTLEAWVSRWSPTTRDLILQMDIEGAEWPILLDASQGTLRRFRIIVVEFHNLEKIFERTSLPIIAAVFNKILEEFVIVHNHPNNYGGVVRKRDVSVPRVLEMTFLRRDRVEFSEPATLFPHPLDRRNTEELADLALPAGWYVQD